MAQESHTAKNPVILTNLPGVEIMRKGTVSM